LGRWIDEASSEDVFFDFFDHVPGDTKKVGDVLDRHAASELQGVLGPGLGVASTDICEADFDLANDATIAALNTRQRGDDDSLLGEHGTASRQH
jgi:hypothetical protein